MSEITVIKRPSESRGMTENGWLRSRHSFSFADYFDSEHMGFCSLRVINEDIVEPGGGFGSHPHHSMEIFSYVIGGALRHEDNQGNGGTIRRGQFQYMSAGSGIMHSERNPSDEEPVHFLQIWLEPSSPGGSPRYEMIDTGESPPDNGLVLLASGDGHGESVSIRQEADISIGKLGEKKRLEVTPRTGRRNFWIQVIEGDLAIENTGEFLLSGDGAAISAPEFSLRANESSEFLLFEL